MKIWEITKYFFGENSKKHIILELFLKFFLLFYIERVASLKTHTLKGSIYTTFSDSFRTKDGEFLFSFQRLPGTLILLYKGSESNVLGRHDQLGSN